jgi:hypothetical protein
MRFAKLLFARLRRNRVSRTAFPNRSLGTRRHEEATNEENEETRR